MLMFIFIHVHLLISEQLKHLRLQQFLEMQQEFVIAGCRQQVMRVHACMIGICKERKYKNNI